MSGRSASSADTYAIARAGAGCTPRRSWPAPGSGGRRRPAASRSGSCRAVVPPHQCANSPVRHRRRREGGRPRPQGQGRRPAGQRRLLAEELDFHPVAQQVAIADQPHDLTSAQGTQHDGAGSLPRGNARQSHLGPLAQNQSKSSGGSSRSTTAVIGMSSNANQAPPHSQLPTCGRANTMPCPAEAAVRRCSSPARRSCGPAPSRRPCTADAPRRPSSGRTRDTCDGSSAAPGRDQGTTPAPSLRSTRRMWRSFMASAATAPQRHDPGHPAGCPAGQRLGKPAQRGGHPPIGHVPRGVPPRRTGHGVRVRLRHDDSDSDSVSRMLMALLPFDPLRQRRALR